MQRLIAQDSKGDRLFGIIGETELRMCRDSCRGDCRLDHPNEGLIVYAAAQNHRT